MGLLLLLWQAGSGSRHSGSRIQIERGEGKPSLETLVDVANALGVSVDSLLQDNVRAGEDAAVREMAALLRAMDEAGRWFLLDVARRYVHYHGGRETR